MKKFFALAAVVICLIAGTTSCKKGGIVAASYKFDQKEIDELLVADGGTAEAADFIQEMNSVMASFSGTEFTDFEIISAFQKVVDKYNNRVISGTFSLYKALGDSDDYKSIKTWTMKFAN